MKTVGANLTETTAGAKANVGQKHIDEIGRQYEYVHANGAITAGHTVLIEEDGEATKLTSTNAGSIGQKAGIACATFKDNYYGWVFRGEGSFEAIVSAGVAADTVMTTTATGGVIGQGGVALDGLRNIDAGVEATRVTVHVPGLLTVGVAAASD